MNLAKKFLTFTRDLTITLIVIALLMFWVVLCLYILAIVLSWIVVHI